MLLACAAFIFVPFIGEQDVLAFGLVCAFTGIALGSDLAMPPSIQADCADWDRYKYRVNRTATLFAYWSMATKLALGVAVGIAFPTLELAGLTDGSETVETSAKWVLIVIYAVLPIVLKLGAVRMMLSLIHI